jgi:hypothetical protein
MCSFGDVQFWGCAVLGMRSSGMCSFGDAHVRQKAGVPCALDGARGGPRVPPAEARARPRLQPPEIRHKARQQRDVLVVERRGRRAALMIRVSAVSGCIFFFFFFFFFAAKKAQDTPSTDPSLLSQNTQPSRCRMNRACSGGNEIRPWPSA